MRTELLALTPDALAALTNRGLVKRATREVGQAPPVITDEADALLGTFPGGVTARLPTGGLAAGSCSCGAPGVCRHLIGLVLAYQQSCAATGPPDQTVDWSPGSFTDDQLAARIGSRLLAAARRAERAGYLARVCRAGPADPVPRVELSTATVRFLVPHDLAFVHTDAATGAREDVLALAVWAFRQADEQAPGEPEVRLEVGGAGTGPAAGDPALVAALALADTVLRDGAVHTGLGLAAAVADVRGRLDAAGLRWPVLAVADLADQLDAYRDRGARYDPEVLAGLIAELHGRHRAVANRGASPRSRVLGTEEAAETPLRRARLTGLGCRVTAVRSDRPGDPDGRLVEFFFAHADSGTVLVLRRQWPDTESRADLARRRFAGVTVGGLAAGNLVTESAVRSASRRIRLTTGRLAKHTVSTSAGAWDGLTAELLVGDLAGLGVELDAMPPRVVRPRIEAELVRVVDVAEVRSVSYSPGRQRLDAVIADPLGGTATISAVHSAAAPGRLDAIALVLGGAQGPVRHVSGVVRRSAGEIRIDPLAFAVDNALAVPDLAPDAGAARLDLATGPVPDPLADTLGSAVGLLAEVAHRGLAHLPSSFPERLRAAAGALADVGLHRVGTAVGAFAGTLGADPGEAAVQAWVDAVLRAGVAADLR